MGIGVGWGDYIGFILSIRLSAAYACPLYNFQNIDRNHLIFSMEIV